jgi:outer membrane murein-binding lipoprotein Lpp
MFIAIFTLICAMVAGAGVIGIYMQLDDLRAEVSRLSVYIDDLNRKLNAMDEEFVTRSDIAKLNQVMKEQW